MSRSAGGRQPNVPLAVTMGEPAGIGGEIALKAWLDRRSGVPAFFVIDDAERLRKLAALLGFTVPIAVIDRIDDVIATFPEALPILHRPLAVPVEPGVPAPAAAAAVIAAIEEAARLALAGRAAGIVTNPIHKKVLYDAGFPFPGHTEMLGAVGGEAAPVMMLASPRLRVVPVTIHVSLREALATLSRERIVRAGRKTAEALRRDFGIAQPRLAVAGLNPHAGEDGALGNEEGAIIAPAVAALVAEGIDATGPYPPDTLFSHHMRNRYDAALCMYHDQALIPLKALDFDGGVNVTLGLPFVRTSPDHGTGLDIAGEGVANPASLKAALRLAADIATRRQRAKA